MGAPAVIVYSPDHITAALRAAEEAGCAVLILSAPEAAASMGAGLFRAMIDLAEEESPNNPFVAALGCGGNAGHALAAIREGIKAVILSDDCPARDRVADIARQNDVQLLSTRIYEASGDQGGDREPLDLMEAPDPLAACREFLHTGKIVPEQAPRQPHRQTHRLMS